MVIKLFESITNNKSPVVAILSGIVILLCLVYLGYDIYKRRFDLDENGDLMIDIDLDEDEEDESFIVIPFSVVPEGSMFMRIDSENEPICLIKLKDPPDDKNAMQIIDCTLVKIEEDTLVAWFNEMGDNHEI